MLRFLLSLVLCINLSTLWADNMKSYAYKIALTPSTHYSPLYKVTLPFVVYQHIMHKNLQDVQIFTTSGKSLPMKFIIPTASITKNKTVLPFFYLSKNAKLSNKSYIFHYTNTMQELNFSANNNTKSSPRTIIVNTEKIKNQFPKALLFSWKQSNSQNWLQKVNLSCSNDLQSKLSIGSAVLASLKQNGNQITHNKISFSTGLDNCHYLILQFPNAHQSLIINSLAMVTTEEKPSLKPTVWKNIEGNFINDIYTFSSTDKLPISALKFTLENDFYNNVRIYTRKGQNTPWELVKAQNLYQLKYGAINLSQDTVSFAHHYAKNWKIVFQNIPSKEPKIKFMYHPAQLEFIAKNNGPFILAFGKREVKNNSTNSSELFYLLKQNRVNQVNTDFSFGPLTQLAGNAALKAPRKKQPYILWAILILGTLFLIFMNIRLFKNVNKK